MVNWEGTGEERGGERRGTEEWKRGGKGGEGVAPVTISGSSQGNSSSTALWIEFQI